MPFYWRTRSQDGPTYHIDYVFVPQSSVGLVQSVHMIEEYARHNGHADLLRERIDGAKGD